MNIREDELYKRVKKQADWFGDAAAKHKLLNRILWSISSVLSVAVAILTNTTFLLLGATSAEIAAILAILLPVVTGYTVMRSPESLWILEINMRNQLRSLLDEIEFSSAREETFSREQYELQYLAIMGEANKKWCQIKEAQSGV